MHDRYTTDYETIQTWIEDHGGFPARIKGVPATDPIPPHEIEIAFDPDQPELERIEWYELFDWIDHNNLALRYTKNPNESGFGLFEFVDRDEVLSELSPSSELPDSGDPETLKENIIPDSE